MSSVFTRRAAVVCASFTSATAMVWCHKAQAQERPPVQNSALVFIKPQANTRATQTLVRDKLRQAGCKIVDEGTISGQEIDDRRLIDQHYYAIASKAGATSPSIPAAQLPVPIEKFKVGFGEDWATVVKGDRAASAMTACARFGCNAAELNEAFRAHEAKDKTNVVKLGGGFYCAKFSVNGHDPLYVFNAFYMAMRSKFVGPDNAIYYFSVQWEERDMQWEYFRGQLLGPTNPTTAPPSSIRGAIYKEWEALGLSAEPTTADNGVHASASPLEGLAEKANWLGASVEHDAFGKALLVSGISKTTIAQWSLDPRVNVPGQEGKSSIWDAVEDMDANAALDFLIKVDKAN